MAIRNIREDGDEVLRKVCKPVEVMTERLSTLIDDMFETMYEDKGIGLASKILIPAVFIIMAIIVIFALTLPGANRGIDTLINPNWNLLWDINIWIVAFSQIIFSLGIGEALALTYATYWPTITV